MLWTVKTILINSFISKRYFNFEWLKRHENGRFCLHFNDGKQIKLVKVLIARLQIFRYMGKIARMLYLLYLIESRL